MAENLDPKVVAFVTELLALLNKHEAYIDKRDPESWHIMLPDGEDEQINIIDLRNSDDIGTFLLEQNGRLEWHSVDINDGDISYIHRKPSA